MKSLFPYINFAGSTVEVLEFYKSVFGGDLNIQKIGDTPMKDQMGPDMNDKVMHASLTTPKFSIGASDMFESMDKGNKPEIGNAISLALDFDSEEELKEFWGKLIADGGKEGHAVQSTFWGAFGDLDDKFGINWMLNYTKPADMEENEE
jgi:PhnB protein